MRMKRGDDEIVMGMLQSGLFCSAARRRTGNGVICLHCACPPGNSYLAGSHSIYGLDADHKRSFSLARTLGLHSMAKSGLTSKGREDAANSTEPHEHAFKRRISTGNIVDRHSLSKSRSSLQTPKFAPLVTKVQSDGISLLAPHRSSSSVSLVAGFTSCIKT